MSKKDDVEIIYPSSIEGETAADLIPKPGADGREFERLGDQATGDEFFEDMKVHLEVYDLAEELQVWVTNRLLKVRSKPARDMLALLNEWAEEQKHSFLDDK